jgi:hypothetical protein
MGLLDDAEDRRFEAERHRENSGRLAIASATFTSKGQGTWQHNKRVAFGATFTERPMVTYGAVCDIDDLADELNLDPEDVVLPLSSGYVSDWDQDDRGFYLGCWVAASVGFRHIDMAIAGGPVEAEAMPVIEHHFTFSAIGIKDIPPDLPDD